MQNLEYFLYVAALPYAAATAWVARTPDGDIGALFSAFGVLAACYVGTALFAPAPFSVGHFLGHALVFACATLVVALFWGKLEEMGGVLIYIMPCIAIITVLIGAIVQYGYHYLFRTGA